MLSFTAPFNVRLYAAVWMTLFTAFCLPQAEAVEAELFPVSQSLTWKRLLYIQTGKAEITDQRFFLTSVDKQPVENLALAELQATLNSADVIFYVTRGLFGGYSSSFSTGTFYQHDQVYSRQEMRDIWSYELQLSADEAEFARLRIAELLGQQFDYYFLSRNCARCAAGEPDAGYQPPALW